MTVKGDAAYNFIRETAIGPDSVQADAFIVALQAQMTAGIRKEKSSLAMIPTWFSCSRMPDPGSRAVAVDFGGTNFRTALIRFSEQGALIEQFRSQPSPGKDGCMEWEDFIGFLAENISPFLKYTRCVAICLCFPTTITPELDGIIHCFTKEIDIRGYEGKGVCSALKEKLGIPDLSIRAINDTTAVLLSALANGAEASGILGIILGTGTNICCQIPLSKLGFAGEGKMIIATETGGFVSPDTSSIDLAVDRDTIAPGVYLEEKKIAGGYLGKICTYAFREAACRGLFGEETVQRLERQVEYTTPEMDAFGSGNSNETAFSGEHDNGVARKIVRAVFARAAKHVALTLAAVLDYSLPRSSSVTVSADGSVFTKSILFREYFFPYMAEYCGDWKISFVTQDEATIIGAAVGAVV